MNIKPCKLIVRKKCVINKSLRHIKKHYRKECITLIYFRGSCVGVDGRVELTRMDDVIVYVNT